MQANDYEILTSDANSGISYRNAVNEIFKAIKTLNSGNTEPLNPEAFMWWVDTADETYYYLKQRNAGNSGWNVLFRYTVANGAVHAISGGAVVDLEALTTAFSEALNSKANKATTLDGYGIEDAYTKEETEALVAQSGGSSIKKPVVSYMSKSGYNSQALLVDGRLYHANGTSAAYHTSGLYANGGAFKLGVSDVLNVRYPSSSPIKKVGGFKYGHAFILTEDAELYTFGFNSFGSCGLGHTTNTVYPTLAATDVIDAYDHSSQGSYSTAEQSLFILKVDGLYAAGNNAQGNCGIGNITSPISTFTKCVGFTNTDGNYIKRVFTIGNNVSSTWVLTVDGKIFVTGYNSNGEHGTGDTALKSSFTDVTSSWVSVGKTVVDIKVGGGTRYYGTGASAVQVFSVMLLMYSDGTSEIKTAGYNAVGTLGDGTVVQRTTPLNPLNIPTDGSVVDIAVFGGGGTCVCQALTATGDLYSWGHGALGNMGNGTNTSTVSTPIIVATGVLKLFSDGMTSHEYGHRVQSIVQKADGLYMSGYNDAGYCAGMGVDVISNVLTYAKVLLPEDDHNVVDVGHFTSNNHNRVFLAYTSKGNLYSWGYNGVNGIFKDTTISVAIPQLIQLPDYSKGN